MITKDQSAFRVFRAQSIVGVTLGVLLFSACAGCEPPHARTTSQPAPIGPRETLLTLIELRASRKYRELPRLVLPGRGADVVEFISAVDAFLTANRRLCNWLRDEVGIGMSQSIDQSYIADDLSIYAGQSLGVFSNDIELLDDAVRGDTATISYAIVGRLPARVVQLRNVNGSWRYDPGRRYNEHLPAAFRELAEGLDLVRTELETGRFPRRDLLAGPEPLLEKVAARLQRGVKTLSRAQAEAATAATQAADHE